MLTSDINFLPIVVSAVAAMVIGFLWYSQALFGKQWIKLMGWTKGSMDKDQMKGMQKTYAVSFVGALVTAYVLSQFLEASLVTTLTEGMMVGFWAWLGFVAPVQLTEVLFGGKSLQLYFLNTGYQLASLLAMGAILAVWV